VVEARLTGVMACNQANQIQMVLDLTVPMPEVVLVQGMLGSLSQALAGGFTFGIRGTTALFDTVQNLCPSLQSGAVEPGVMLAASSSSWISERSVSHW